MDPITIVKSKVAPLDRADVDTDQIIPKQFLKRVERTARALRDGGLLQAA